MSISICRYAGGKTKFVRHLASHILQEKVRQYREPFVGGGAIGLHLITAHGVSDLWITDRDPTVYCVWMAIAQHPSLFKQAICELVPSIEEFRRIKSKFLSSTLILGSPEVVLKIAVEKIVLQQMSYSGFGQMAGGPLGGWNQLNGGLTSRWNPSAICAKIDLLHPYLRNARIINLDFAELLNDGSGATIYLDPPYFNVGNSLYQHAFSTADHARLAQLLRFSEHRWVLSYNDCPEAHELYSFAQIHRIEATYSTSKRCTQELVITPPCSSRTWVGYNPPALAASRA